MKLNEFFVAIFGSTPSKKEYEQIKLWRDEGSVNASQLREMSRINKTSSALKSYQQFDVESALEKSLQQIQKERPSKIKYYIAAFLILALLSIGFNFNKINSQSNTQKIHTALEEIKILEKNDGSAMTIAAGSELIENTKYNQYTLNGKAYFDIEKQENPLIIKTKDGIIQVLGTSFDVVTNDEVTKVFMYEGKIKYENTNSETFYVEAGEVLTSTNEITKVENKFNSQVSSFWRTNKLSYKNISLTNVLNDISSLYGKEFIIEKNKYDLLKISADFNNLKLQDIIKELEVITGTSIMLQE